MEYDLIFKLSPLLVGLIGTAKFLYEFTQGGRSRLRDEYHFAKEFLKTVEEEPLMHPFLREKGYQVIAGDRSLSASEVEYLLSLQRPNEALRDYVLGRPYLEHLQCAGDQQLSFKVKYTRPFSRLWRKMLYLFFYAASVFMASAPLLLNHLISSLSQVLIGFLFSAAVFLPTAWFSLVAAARVFRAERLVKNQSKHTLRVVVNKSNSSLNR